MIPMTVRCDACGDFIPKGIQQFRFYINCSRCSGEITFKTDPKNSDYVVESGAKQNFEPWRAEEEEIDRLKRIRVVEEMGNAMKALENKAADSKIELDVVAALDEIKSLKSRHAGVNVDAMLIQLQVLHRHKEEEEELCEDYEALIRSVFKGRGGRSSDQEGYGFVRRIEDDDDDNDSEKPKSKRRKLDQCNTDTTTTLAKASCDGKFIIKPSSIRISVLKKPHSDSNANKANNLAVTSDSLQSIFQYQSDSDEDC